MGFAHTGGTWWVRLLTCLILGSRPPVSNDAWDIWQSYSQKRTFQAYQLHAQPQLWCTCTMRSWQWCRSWCCTGCLPMITSLMRSYRRSNRFSQPPRLCLWEVFCNISMLAWGGVCFKASAIGRHSSHAHRLYAACKERAILARGRQTRRLWNLWAAASPHTHTHTSWIQISPHLSTVYQAFVLQHVIVHQTHAPELMCLCFVNLKAAYDKVQWPLIWQVLQRLGIHGTCSVDCLTQFTQTAP